MTEQELREKIVEILNVIQDYGYVCRINSRSGECYNVSNKSVADALIAAGIGDVSEYKEKLKLHRVFVRKDGGDIKVLYGNKEVDEIIKERDEYKHRTKVAEKQVYCLAKMFAEALCKNGNPENLMQGFIKDAQKQAEKELQAERKDD